MYCNEMWYIYIRDKTQSRALASLGPMSIKTGAKIQNISQLRKTYEDKSYLYRQFKSHL
jgi:hypothetical protein